MARFDYDRAEAFGHYVVPALLEEANDRDKTYLVIARDHLRQALNTAKLHDEHIECVRKAAASEAIGTAVFDRDVVFFWVEEKDSERPEPTDMVAVTDAFARVYGSSAADEMYENDTYRAPPAPRAKPAKSGKATSVRLRG